MEPPSTSTLAGRTKAAIIVHLMIEGGGGLCLHELPESMQDLLTEELGSLRRVDRQTLEQVAEEFVAELESIGLTAPGSRDDAILALSDHLSPPLAARLHEQLASVRNGDHWPKVIALPEARIVTIMQAESIEVAAIALSKMPVSKAAAVLARLDGDRARRITYAMSKTDDIAPQTVHRIGIALAQDYARPVARAFEKAPVQRLGAILNAAATDTREGVLAGLDATDQPFASDVRRAIFTFKDIAPRVKPADIPNCIRAVDADVLATAIAAALAGAEPLVASAEFMLASLSQRMAGQLRDAAQERGTPTKDAGEVAMAEVTKAIRDQVESGIITLIDPDAADSADATKPDAA